jgi:hypothetical protein
MFLFNITDPISFILIIIFRNADQEDGSTVSMEFGFDIMINSAHYLKN